jgi:hypothetical protein
VTTSSPEGSLHHSSGRKFSKFTQHHVNEGGGGDETLNGSEVDEARYNLATRVMSNGVELIVADGKSTFPGEPNFFRILTNSKNYNRPLTLAPSTLNNKMMLMTLGVGGGKNPKVKVHYELINYAHKYLSKISSTKYSTQNIIIGSHFVSCDFVIFDFTFAFT